MPVITISRGAYSKGTAIAEKLAHKLGYECISRKILLEASEHFNTCHNPHRNGVIPAERAGAKGADSKFRHRLPGKLCLECHLK